MDKRIWANAALAATAMGLLSTPSSAQRAVPAANGSSFTLTTGGTVLQVGAANSARVNSLKHQGAEMLYLNSSGGNILWGSTFWPSPQTDWTPACKSASNASCWPPPAALDGNAYTGGSVQADTAIVYSGAADNGTKLRFRKTFSADLGDSSFTNLYHMVNTSSSPVSFAPWEDTRFPSGGITFWPTGAGAPTGNATMLRQTRDTLGATWFVWDSSASLSGSTKIFADGGAAGWMAHVDKSRVLFIKKFVDTPPSKKAPGVENECEIYITSALQEMELQGPYTTIPGNDSLAWEVKWFVRKLPDNIPVSRNKALFDFVGEVVRERTTAIGSVTGRPGAKARLGREGRALVLNLDRAGNMRIELFDAKGGRISRLAEGRFETGRNPIAEISDLPSGPHWVVVREVRNGRAGAVILRRLLVGD